MPLRRAARGPAALALSSPASTVPCPPPARGPPTSQRRVLGVELREGAGRAAPGKRLAGVTACGRRGGFLACLTCGELGFVARRAAWDGLGRLAEPHSGLSRWDCRHLGR